MTAVDTWLEKNADRWPGAVEGRDFLERLERKRAAKAGAFAETQPNADIETHEPEPERPSGTGTDRKLPNPDHKEAVQFVRSLPDDEPFAFLVAMKEALAEHGRLTPKQVAAVLKCKAARSKPKRDARIRPLDDVPDGTYAVDDSKGKLRFLHVEHATKGRWTGTTFIGEEYGGRDSRDKRGYIDAGGASHYVSDETEALLEAIRKNPLEASKRYGKELGVCGICHKTLTDKTSRTEGIGPVCARRFG